MIFHSYKWIVFFIFLVTFPTEAKDNIFSKKNSSKKIENFFLIKSMLKKNYVKIVIIQIH